MTATDVYNDPYSRRRVAREKRREFEKFKRTKEFKSWKNIQLRAQKYKCAYCRIKLKSQNIVTHIDHVTPLYHEGKNNIDNLVLSCRRCNIRKWTSNRYVYPQWIIDSKRHHRVKILRSSQKKLMKELVNQELDEQLLNSDLSWL